MKSNFLKFICFLTVLLLMISGCVTPESQLVGTKAPDFTLDRLDNGSVSLTDLSGKPVLLEFWAPWCPGCLDNIAPMKELYSRFAGRVHIIAPSLEENRKSISAFVQKHNIPYPIILATRNFLSDYQISTIPVTIIIDKNGIIRKHHLGRIKVEDISGILESLL